MGQSLLLKILIVLIFSENIAEGELNSLAQFIKDGIEQTVNPCNDFYSYVCSSSERTVAGFKKWDTNLLIATRIYSMIKEMLKNKVEILKRDDNKRKLRKDIEWINTCVNEEDSQKAEIFKIYINVFGTWPMFSGKSNIFWQEVETHFTRLQGQSTFFQLSLENDGFQIDDPINRRSFALLMDSKNDQYVRNVINFSIELLKSTENQDNIPISSITNLPDKIKQLKKFQKHWKKIIDKYPEPCKIVNLMTLQEETTKNLKTDINWLTIFEAMFEKTDLKIPVSSINVCVNIDYWKEFTLYLSNISRTIIVNYIYTTLILNDVSILKNLDDPENSLNYCIKTSPLISGFLSEISDTPEIEEKKNYVLNMFGEIQKQFKIEINRSWINTDLRKILIEKLRKMKIYFLNFNNNNNNNDKILPTEVSYEFEVTDSFAENLFNFRKAQFQNLVKLFQHIKKLGSSQNIDDSCYYFSPMNAIVVPAEMMLSEFVDVNNPISMNYGTIGFIIAHEIGHGMDLHDYQNIIESGTETHTRYFDYLNCLINQMDEYNVSSYYTLSENYADAVGVKVAFNALKRIVCQDKNTDEEITELDCRHWIKLFFITLTSYFCKQPVTTDYKNGDTYPPILIRINHIASNMNAFLKEFRCIEGNLLYRNQQCHVWSEK